MKYRYVVVEIPNGGSWLLYGDPLRSKTKRLKPNELTSMPDLLAEGWMPVREVPIGTSRHGLFGREYQHLSLVLLSKED